jgi:hypothetical protein
MMLKRSSLGNDAQDLTGCACAFPSCTITVGRARLLYGLLESTGMDKMHEIKAKW